MAEMDYLNRSSGSNPQHTVQPSACPYINYQNQHRSVSHPEPIHNHQLPWISHNHSPYQWSAPPPSGLELPRGPQGPQGLPQLRMPPISNFEPYQFLPGALPPPQLPVMNFQPSNNQDASFGAADGLPPPGQSSTGHRPFHSNHSSRSSGPSPPSHIVAPPAPPPIHPPPQHHQHQHQTQQTLPSPLSHSSSSHPSHHLHHTHGNRPAQAPSHQGANRNPSSSTIAPSLLPHPQPQQQQQQQQSQRTPPLLPPQHQNQMASVNSGMPLAPSSHARSGHTNPHPAQTQQSMSSQAPPDQRQQALPQSSQSHHQRHSNPGVIFIPPNVSQHFHLPNPNQLPRQFGHDYPSPYGESMPLPLILVLTAEIIAMPPGQHDFARPPPPQGIPAASSEIRRRGISARSARRNVARAHAFSPERDRDSDEDHQPPAHPDAFVDGLFPIGLMRQGSGDDRQLRAAQFFRGSVSTKMVASASAISSLESVDVDTLPEGEKSCIICYNDFGTETPEGVREAPLRLPVCKHVFGDHCIKKWFDESDSCPYCRTKVPSEPRFSANSRALLELIRARGGPVPPVGSSGVIPQELLLRVFARDGQRDPEQHEPNNPARRSPPTESAEPRRRIRARYSGNMSSRQEGPLTGSTRPSSFSGVPSSGSMQSSPSRDHRLFPDHHLSWNHERERDMLAARNGRANVTPPRPRIGPGAAYYPTPLGWDDHSPIPPPSHPAPTHHNTPHTTLAPREHPFLSEHATAFVGMPVSGLHPHRDADRNVPDAANGQHPVANGVNSPGTSSLTAGVDTPMPDRGPAL
ncbi:hypothetical protein jhhlp_002307 [Lomentospora prolificans]|uniref:RING-type domain-containing protein n=1 Tax=Lomentospora prolificans TaxID=41688 RepID=A0A2N3NDQ7_9PEZI|nr:hypothetical protein jhhlp_002307 [Lomentospora prolificans]